MKTFKLTYPHTMNQEELPKTVAAIGFFDGIHQGHQKVIKTAIHEAKARKMESAVITFHPHPSVVLMKKKGVKYITPLREKQDILKELGVDRLYIITFNKELSSLSPQKFIDHFIIGMNIKHIVAGFDYTFGYKGEGNMGNLGEFTRGAFSFTTIDKVEQDGEKVSSTKMRKLLADGDVEAVRKMLGRPLTLHGVVVEGAKRGRKIGFPTANLKIGADVLLPKPGIYAVKVVYKDIRYIGMASLGTNPTFTEDRTDLSLEVNLLDFNEDLYGEELALEWYTFIRDEQKFDHVEDLIKQIEEDEKVIRRYFSTEKL